MAHRRFVTYFRVSTDRQGRSGLGMEAQRVAVETFLNGGHCAVLASFTEIESGTKDHRPELAKAIAHCRLTGATLLIAKIDRLSRNAAFTMNLLNSETDFECADMPGANRFTIGMMALVAQQEAEMISQRTKDALAASRIRRQKTGKPPLGGFRGGPVVDYRLGVQACQAKAIAFSASVEPVVRRLRDDGLSLRGIAAELTARSIRTPRGGAWTAKHVMQILQ